MFQHSARLYWIEDTCYLRDMMPFSPPCNAEIFMLIFNKLVWFLLEAVESPPLQRTFLTS